MVDASVDGMFAFDRHFHFTAWNWAMQRITGKTREEVIGKSAFDVFPFLRETDERQHFASALEGNESVSENHPFGPSESGIFESHYSPLRDDISNVVGGIA